MVGSEQITSALFGYGSFDQQSVNNSAKALFYFSFGLPAFSLIKIFSTFLFARNDTKTPFKYSLNFCNFKYINKFNIFFKSWFYNNTNSNNNFFMV